MRGFDTVPGAHSKAPPGESFAEASSAKNIVLTQRSRRVTNRLLQKNFPPLPLRDYPKDQSRRTMVLVALIYALGLSCSATSHLLSALRAEVCKMSVWRDAQEAGRSSESVFGKGEGWTRRS